MPARSPRARAARAGRLRRRDGLAVGLVALALGAALPAGAAGATGAAGTATVMDATGATGVATATGPASPTGATTEVAGPRVGSAPAPSPTTTVARTAPGRSYLATATVRALTPLDPFAASRTARLVVRETTAAGRVVTAGAVPVRLVAASAAPLRLAVRPTAAGHRLDVRVELRGLGLGDRFAVGRVAVTAVPVASVLPSAATVRPDRPLPAGAAASADVAAARNDTASFQVALRTGGSPLPAARVALDGPLRGPGGATIAATAVALARERPYRVQIPTDGEGEAGLWPDALIPDRDPLLGGDGGAFPVDIPADGAETVWVDVAVPPTAAAGDYAGTLRVTAAGAPVAEVPVRLRVRPFTLPATSSLRSLFVVNPYRLCAASDTGGAGGYAELRRPDRAGCDASDERTWRLFSRVARLGLRNRVSIADPYPTPRSVAPSTRDAVRPRPARPGAPTDGAAAFATYVRPLLDGTTRLGALPGARLTTLTTQWECLRERGARCTADWRALLAARAPEGLDRFLPWVCDEPAFDDAGHFTPWRGDADRDGCERNRRLAREGWPGVPVKITSAIDDRGLYADGRVDPSALEAERGDVLAPNAPDVATRDDGDQRDRYDAWTAATGTDPWLYLSCTSGGCDPGRAADDPALRDPAHDGWPSYAIDQPGSQASALGWMAFVYRAGGESLFDVAAGFSEGPDFQQGIDLYGANGDGDLLYPGRVVVRGPTGVVREPLPLETIRLKRIREGREDYEVLLRLQRCGRRADALAVARDLFGPPDRAMFSTTVTPAALDAARDRLAELVVRHAC